MKKLKIIFDVDDIIVPYTKECLKVIEKQFKIHTNYDDVTWGFKNLPSSVEEYAIKYLYGNSEFMKTLTINEIMVDMINNLIDYGHEILFATAVYSSCATTRALMLQNNFPKNHPKNTIITGRKDLLFADIMFDDCLKHIFSSQCIYPIIFDQPWNRIDKIENFNSIEELEKCKKYIRVYNNLDIQIVIKIIELEYEKENPNLSYKNIKSKFEKAKQSQTIYNLLVSFPF